MHPEGVPEPFAINEPHHGHHPRKLAQLSGHPTRASDPPPGNQIFWRGLTRLHAIHLGYLLAKKDVGN